MSKCTITAVTTTKKGTKTISTVNTTVKCKPGTKPEDMFKKGVCTGTVVPDKTKTKTKTKTKKSSSKWWLWLIIALVVVAGVWYFVGRKKGETGEQEKDEAYKSASDGENAA